MPCTRYIIVCEGESERAYLQRLQSFLDKQPLAHDAFVTPLQFIAPLKAIAKGGEFKTLKNQYKSIYKDNKKSSICIWADFDLYHRNEKNCASNYAAKTIGIPHFHFSFHNFEDFYALHLAANEFQQWRNFGNQCHFAQPLHANDYIPQFNNIVSNYRKGDLAVDFITWDSLKNLKQNKPHQPDSNPHNLQGIMSFADFLISAIEHSYPESLI